MTLSPADIAEQQDRLATHRRTLAHWLRQAAQFGGIDLAPPVTANGIVEARREIARIKEGLRAAGVAVEDHPDDGDEAAGDALLPSLQPPAELPDLFPIANDLIGRAAERDRLNDWFEALAAERHGRYACITAPHGFGKRALLNTLVDDVRAGGGVALLVRFWPTARADADARDALWDDDPLLDPAVAAREAAIEAAWPKAARIGGRGWVRLVAQLAHTLDRPLTPQSERLPDDPTALKALLRRAARGGGLLLAIEALDDADDLWIDLLRDLAPEIERDLPVLVVATLTLPVPLDQLAGEQLTEALHLVKTLHAEGRAEILWLDAITSLDVAAYLGDVEAALAHQLVAISDGIPAVAESLWQSWEAEGVVAQDAEGVWRVADDRRGWVFGDLRDALLAQLKARLPADAPLNAHQVDTLLGVAALEGPAFTVQAVARAHGHDPDVVLKLCDRSLLDDDERPGLLADVGFVEIPGAAAAQRPYLYRFTYAHLWHHWRKYGVPERQRAMYQGRLAEALELVYYGATDQVAARLAALFEASGQSQRADPYRRRVKQTADLVVILWQIGLLEQHARDDFDGYRLYELRIEASGQLYQAGRYAEGFAQASAALAQAEAWRDNVRIARAANLAGMNLHAQGDYAAARPLYERALAIRRAVVGERHPHTAESLNNLGNLLHVQGDLPGARPYFEQALAIYREVVGERHPVTATSLNNLGALLYAQGDLAGARPYLEQALAIRRAVVGERHPVTATSLNNLGGLLYVQGDLTGARLYCEQALAIRRAVVGERHPDTAESLNNLGNLLHAQGDLAGARPYLEQALVIWREVLGERHPHTAESLNNLGNLLQAQGDLTGARLYCEQALAIRRAVVGERHPAMAESLNNLGNLLQAQGDLAGARPYFEQSLAIRRAVLGERHPDTALSLNNLGALLRAHGDLAGARLYYEQALAMYEQTLGPDHPHTRMVRKNLTALDD